MNFNKIFFNNIIGNYLEEGDAEELIQFVVGEEEAMGHDSRESTNLEKLPLLVLKNTTLFPYVIIPITLKQKQAVSMVETVYQQSTSLGVVTQKTNNVKELSDKDLYKIGTIAKVLKVIDFHNGKTTVILHGKQKISIKNIITEPSGIVAQVQLLKDQSFSKDNKKSIALFQSIKEVAIRLLKLRSDVPPEAQAILENIKNPEFLTYFLASNLNADIHYKQKLLEMSSSTKRANLLLKHLLKDLEFSELRKDIQKKVHSDISQQQRDFYLRQQVKILQDELGEGDSLEEIDVLREKGKNKHWPQEVAAFFNKALDKAERISSHSPDYATIVNHAGYLVDLPWNTYTKDNLDIKRAQKIFDGNHYGIEKVKERLLEYLSVLHLKKDIKGPILCLYGPPGVGKTSLGQSISKVMNRKYVRIALGGVGDEAEIRGHRKTYIGAMPGRIIQNIQKVGVSNPVFVLDEIDKLDNMRGDPAAALLEVLDPEQNNAFVDNFLEVPYDLSKVLFIATANSIERISPVLQDRMEVIEVSGYILEEKIHIAKKYLFPKQRKEHGLKAADIQISDDAIIEIIGNYTQESGVRELTRQLGAICRKVARSIASKESYCKKIKLGNLVQLLGSTVFDRDVYQQTTLPGVAIGLAWTPVGGEILFIESTLSKGKGKLTLSGHLGEVMKESAITALSYLKANEEYLDIGHPVFDHYDLHIHVPAGAIPKDGPSAGITLFTSLVSLYTQRKVKDKLAMTGEITLRGKVLSVGGIKEKILAAKRVGIKEIILSKKNKKDVEEIKPEYTKGLIFHYVDSVDEVYQLALQPNKVQNAKIWDINQPVSAMEIS